jgi:GAF domain-containing protein
VGGAIKQARLYNQVQRLNTDLEQQVAQRTEELQTALEFEATLKRITDRVRDSLDVNQIMLTAVKELTEALEVKGSNTSLYDLEQGTSTIYEYNSSSPSYQGGGPDGGFSRGVPSAAGRAVLSILLGGAEPGAGLRGYAGLPDCG